MQSPGPEEAAMVLRVISKTSMCLLLQNGPGAVIQADLKSPLTPRTFVSAQSVNPMHSIPAKVVLGSFYPETCKFLDCVVDADFFTGPVLTRLDYLARKKPQ